MPIIKGLLTYLIPVLGGALGAYLLVQHPEIYAALCHVVA